MKSTLLLPALALAALGDFPLWPEPRRGGGGGYVSPEAKARKNKRDAVKSAKRKKGKDQRAARKKSR